MSVNEFYYYRFMYVFLINGRTRTFLHCCIFQEQINQETDSVLDQLNDYIANVWYP